MPRLVYSANYLIEANKTNIVPQVVGMVEISSGGFAPGTITAHATFPLPSPYNYDGRLRDVSSIDCSLNGAYGRVSFAITNADLGEVANVAADKYVGWECKVHKIIILEDGTLLGILLLHGVITSYTMTDRVVDMDVVTRINVGNTITPRRVNVKCPWVFKGTECGYSGVLTTCNKLYTDADGCSGRSNQHRFGGFPLRLPEASIGAVSGQGGAPTYQLIRDDSAFQLQRAILEFDNTFSVTDDPTNNKTVISVTGGGGGGSGTVTSVALTAPSFLTVTGSPVTTSGTLALALATQNANTVFAGPTTGSAAAPTFRALVTGDIPDLSSIYQPLDADLTAIAALTANGLLRKTAGVWAMDSASYLTANQTITLSGDVTGTGATSIATTIANGAVTFAKMQSIATGRLLGRTTGGIGPIEEITPGMGVLTWITSPTVTNLSTALNINTTGSVNWVFSDSPTLTTPRIAQINVNSTRAVLGFIQSGNSVNYLQITNSVAVSPFSTGGPTIESVGTSADVNFWLKSKGGGNIDLSAGTLGEVNIRSLDPNNCGVLHIRNGNLIGAQLVMGGLTIGAPLGGSGIYTLPAADGTSGQALTTDGAGVLSWSTFADLSPQADHAVLIGPLSGGPTAPTWRGLALSDLPAVATNRLLGRVSPLSGDIEEITPGANVLTWLQTPSSANLAAAVTDETGSGALVFATSPTLVTPNIGVATGTSFNSITGLSSTTPSATVTTTAVVGTATAAARADHVHSIADDAVTYAKMQDVSAASRLLGRGSASGSGDVQEITVGGGIEFTSSTGIQTTALTGDVTKTAGGTSTTIANNAVTTAKVADAAITPAKLSAEAQVLAFKNRLINGSFVIDQRNAGATTSIADDVYCFDRWYILSQTSTVQVVRQTNTANGIPTNIRITQNQASAQRCGIAQIIESINCRDLRGKSVVLDFDLRCSSSQAIRYAILEWTGTADSVTSDIVNSWTNGTFTTGQFFNSTSLTLVGTGSITPSANTWTTATALTGTVSSSANNLIVFIWSEGTLAQNATLDLAKVQLERGSTPTDFEVLPYGQILSQCEYYTTTFSGEVEFNQSLGIGWVNGTPGSTGTQALTQIYLPTTMRLQSPTVTISSATHFAIGGPVGQQLTALTIAPPNSASTERILVLVGTVASTNVGLLGQFRCDSTSARLVIDAEL